MAVVDDFGRVTRLTEDLKSLADSLKASVGKAMEYATGKAKDSADKMKDEFDKLVDAMEELGDDVKENLKSTKEFVDQVKKAADSVEKIKSQRATSGRDTMEAAQREQTRILQQILAAQKKAISDKAAKFTSGATALSSPPSRKAGLKEMGFRPRGADKIPAMVSPGEFVVSKKGARGNEGVLDRINRGYFRGGRVKPQYLAEGTGGRYGRDFSIRNTDKVVEIIVDGKYDQKVLDDIRRDFAHLGEEVSVKFAGEFDKQLKKSAARWFTSMATAFTGGGDPWQVLFEGAVKDVTEFRREMRNLAFQTEGITGNFREAQAEFAKIGENIAGRTGVNVTAFQKAYMNNARKGFKDQKAGMRVLESGLKLSTLIGSESQATASLFADWHRELGLGAVQMERMANNMQMVARNTGVTGDELTSVMKSSEQILKNLRNQGTLTTTAARNVTQTLAEFKKQGFEEAGQSMLSAMSGYSAFNAADKGTKTFLQIAADRGGVDQLELMHGQVLQDQEKMGKIGTGLRDFLAQNAGFKPEDYDKFDMDLLSEDQRRQLSIVLDSMGKSLGDADAAMKAVGKSAKGLGGELSDLDKASKSVTATQEQRKQAEKKMNDRLLSASMDQLGGLMGAAEKFSDKDLGGLAEELGKDTKFGREFQGAAKDMAAMIPYLSDSMRSQFGLSGTSEQMAQQMSAMDVGSQMNLRSLAAAEQLDKALAAQGKNPQDFSKRMQAALAKGDTAGFKTIAGEMSAAYQESQVADAAGVDPMEQLEQTMTELNQTIRNTFSPLTGAVLDLIGPMGLLGIQIGLMGSSIFNLVGGDFLKYLKPGNLRDAIKGGFNKAISGNDGIWKFIGSKTGNGFLSMGGTMGGAARSTFLINAFKAAVGPLALLLGGIKGVMESGEAKRTKLEGGILGALTGGAKTGSFLSPMLGVQKGSAGDKALGVAGAAAWGAAIGSVIPVVGTLAGALIGAGVEILKIITEGTDILQDMFAPLQVVVNFIYNTFKNLWDVIAGIVTLDIGRVFKGIFNQIGNVAMLIPRLLMGIVQQIAIGIPKLFLRVLSFIWEIPKAIMGAIKSALEGLVNNPWVGPIFKVLSDAFNMIYDGFMAIWTPISEIFSGLYRVVSDIGKAIFGAGEGGGVLAGIMWALQKAVYAVSYAISWLLIPIKVLAWALGFVLKIVGKLIAGIIYPFQYLYDVLVGHSIVPDLVTGIISWFASLPGKIFKFLVGIPIKILKKMPKALVGVFTAVFHDFPKWLLGKMSDGIWAVGNFLFVTLPKMMWDGFKNALKNMGKWLWDVLTWPFKKIGELLKAVFWDFPIWLGNKIMDGLHAIFVDLPTWLGGIIMSGLQAIFYDLPMWLGKTIWDGMGQVVSGIPGAIYGALHSAASAIGLGWLVERMAGGKKTPPGAATGKGATPTATAQAGAASAAGNLAVGATAVAAGAVALKKVSPKVVGMAKDAFGQIGKVVPKDIGKHASTAFQSIKTGANKAFAKMGGLMPKSMSKLVARTKSFFTPMTKGFSRSMASGQGIFKSVARGVKAQMGSVLRGRSIAKLASGAFDTFKKITPTRITKAASGAFKSVKTFFSPMAKGFSRSIAKGDGLLKAMSRGVKSQIASMPKMRAMTKFASDAFKNAKLKGVLPKGAQKLATESFKGLKNFFSPMTKGFSRSMAKGDGVFKAISRGARGQVASMLRGGNASRILGRFGGLPGNISKTASGLLGRVKGLPGNISKTASGLLGGRGGEMLNRGLGMVKGVGARASGVLGKAGGLASSALGKAGGAASGVVGKAGGMLSSVAGKGVGALAKKIPVVGALLDFGLRKASGQSTGKAATGTAGGLAGAAAGAAIGSAIFPVVGTAIGAIVGGLGGGWLADKLYDNVGPVFKTVGKGISDAATFTWDGIKKVGSTLWEGAKGLGSKLWEGTKTLTSKMADGAKWLRDNVGSAMFGPIGLVAKGIKNFGSWLFGTGDKDKENKGNIAANMAMARIEAQTVVLSTAVGHHAVPTVNPEGKTPPPNVEPVHLRDITGTILRDRAGSGGNKMQSDELSRMEEASYRQVEELEQIRQGIQELVSLMKPKGGIAGASDPMGPGNTKDPRRPMHAARFGKMKFGVAGGMANRSFVNNGEV